MKKTLCAVMLFGLLTTALSAYAQQGKPGKQAPNAVSVLQNIALPSSQGDTIRIAQAIAGSDYTLIVMYRGIW